MGRKQPFAALTGDPAARSMHHPSATSTQQNEQEEPADPKGRGGLTISYSSASKKWPHGPKTTASSGSTTLNHCGRRTPPGQRRSSTSPARRRRRAAWSRTIGARGASAWRAGLGEWEFAGGGRRDGRLQLLQQRLRRRG